MRIKLIFLNFLLFSCLSVCGQTRIKSYQVIFANDTFKTETILERDPVNKKVGREYSYLFRNHHQIIKIPRRIDVIHVRSSDRSWTEVDTVDQIEVSAIVDTISKFQLNEIINSEIQIYSGTTKLKFDEAQFETVYANGKTSFTIDLQKTKIKEEKYALESVTKLDAGGYLIFHALWFYDQKKQRQEIECNIAWFIK